MTSKKQVVPASEAPAAPASLPPGYAAGAAVSGAVIGTVKGVGSGLGWIGTRLWGFAKGVARTNVEDVHPAR